MSYLSDTYVEETRFGFWFLRSHTWQHHVPKNVSYPYLWWSRAKDFGLFERCGLRQPKPVGQREETLVNVVARKPLEGCV
jgi:hypothetical protein